MSEKYIRVRNKENGNVVTMSRERFEMMRREKHNNTVHLEPTNDPVSYARKRRPVQVSMHTPGGDLGALRSADWAQKKHLANATASAETDKTGSSSQESSKKSSKK